MNPSSAGTFAMMCAVAAIACGRHDAPQSSDSSIPAPVSSRSDATETAASTAAANPARHDDADVRAFVASVTADGITESSSGGLPRSVPAMLSQTLWAGYGDRSCARR
jgi:hypothetical protein